MIHCSSFAKDSQFTGDQFWVAVSQKRKEKDDDVEHNDDELKDDDDGDDDDGKCTKYSRVSNLPNEIRNRSISRTSRMMEIKQKSDILTSKGQVQSADGLRWYDPQESQLHTN